MARGGKKIREMTPDEKRAYDRESQAMHRARTGFKQPRTDEQRAQARKYQAEFRERHRERLRQQRWDERLAETPEEAEARRIRIRAYDEKTKDRKNERSKQYRDANPEKHREWCRRYREEHLEEQRKKDRESKAKNKEKYRESHISFSLKRRARKAGAGECETIHLRVLAERDDWICHLCGGTVTTKSWSMDHLVPISKGGDHTYANVKLAHKICNTRRSNRTLPIHSLFYSSSVFSGVGELPTGASESLV
jgi:5-methylcytosine-specific restriction endonuclease McrA